MVTIPPQEDIDLVSSALVVVFQTGSTLRTLDMQRGLRGLLGNIIEKPRVKL